MSDVSIFIAQHLWESSFFGLICALMIFALGRSWSYSRHFLAWASFLKFLVPFSVFAPLLDWLPISVAKDGAVIAPVAPVVDLTSGVLQIDLWMGFEQGKMSPHGLHSFELLSMCFWALGFSVLSALWIRQYYLMFRSIRKDCIQAGERWNAIARSVWEKPLRLMPKILVCKDDGVLAGVFGFYRQTIVVPRSFCDGFDRHECEAFLRHEFQHVYKRDILWLFVQKFIRNLFWLHPLVWWLDRQISAEREILRDEEVIRKTKNVTSYLNCLMKASNIELPSSYATSVGIKGSPFAKRVKAISRIKESRLGDILSACGSGLAVSALTLFLSASLSVSELRAEGEVEKEEVANIVIEPDLTDEEAAVVKEILSALNQENDREKAYDLTYQAITEESTSAFEFIAANLHAEDKELEKAIDLYQAAINKFPYFLRAVRNMAILETKIGHYESAKGNFFSAIRLGAEDSTTYGLLGLCHFNTKDWTSAEHYYRLAMEKDPSVNDWSVGLAKTLYQQGKTM